VQASSRRSGEDGPWDGQPRGTVDHGDGPWQASGGEDRPEKDAPLLGPQSAPNLIIREAAIPRLRTGEQSVLPGGDFMELRLVGRHRPSMPVNRAIV
jgi:hypothetical protein